MTQLPLQNKALCSTSFKYTNQLRCIPFLSYAARYSAFTPLLTSSIPAATATAGDILGQLYVSCVDQNGSIESKTLPIKQLMKSMHAREILALGVTSSEKSEQQRRIATPLLLPRGHSIYVSFGNIKAIIKPSSVTALEPHLPVVSTWLNDMGDFLAKYGVSSEQSFQLFCLEDILREMCDTFDRRMVIFGPLVNSLLLEVDSSLDASEGFQKLIPLKDALYEFEMAVKEAQRCILDILDNEVRYSMNLALLL